MSFLLVLFVFAFLVSGRALKAQIIQVSKDNRTVSVSATATAMAKAEVATVHVGFKAYGPTHDAAYREGSRLSNAIVKALTDAGAVSDRIESQRQTVAANEEDESDVRSAAERARRRFVVEQTWTVRTTAKESSHILDAAIEAGANDSGEIEWSVADESAAQAEATAKAMQAALSTAKTMAQALGARLGPLVYASDEVEVRSPEIPSPSVAGVPRAPMMMSVPKVRPLVISPQSVVKTATVHAVFLIE